MCTRPRLGKWSAKLGPIVILLATSAYPLSAATVTVCPSGCDSTTIQGAVTMADPGDTIQILSSQAHTEGDIFVGKDVTIAGFGTDTTTIQADANPGTATVPVFAIVGGATVTIQSLKIQYGGGFYGGGVKILDGHLVLEDVYVTENKATIYGGGVYVPFGSSLEIIDGWIWGNEAGDRGAGIFNEGTTEMGGAFVTQNTIPLGSSGDKYGGGIFNSGALTLRYVYMSGNTVGGFPLEDAAGGAIYHEGTELVVEDSRISSNEVDGGQFNRGGGLYMDSSVPVTISRTKISANEASDGGGVYLGQGDLSLVDCWIDQNMASGSGGGLDFRHSGSSAVSVVHSTVSRNHAYFGGGIAVGNDGDIRIVNSTFSGNSATGDAGGLWLTASNNASIASVTITDNTADVDADGNGNGGGIVIATGGDVNMRNTILANNHDDSPFPSPIAFDCVGTIQSQGYNLVRSLGFPAPWCTIEGDTTGNISGTDPVLIALADNGGPTLTHALDPASPAIDAADAAGCVDPMGAPLPVDQRHGVRQDRCDMGAYEVGASFGLIFGDGFESGDTGAWSSVTGG